MKYELFYSSGGHGGPYKNLKESICAAKRLLKGGTDLYIEVRELNFKTVRRKFYNLKRRLNYDGKI